jgi:hypothetical protein
MRYFGQRENVHVIVSYCNESDMQGRETEREREREVPVVPGTQTATGSTVSPRPQKGPPKSIFLDARDRICLTRHYHAKPALYNGRCICYEDSCPCLHFLHLTLSERSTACRFGLKVQRPTSTPVTSL